MSKTAKNFANKFLCNDTNPGVVLKIKHMNSRCVFLSLTMAAICFIILSCSKNKTSDVSLFYGRWKSTIGDTITFFQRSGQNLCDAGAGSPGPDFHEIEFSYSNSKLKFKDGAADPGRFRTLQTFKWIQYGTSFEVDGNDFYFYISSIPGTVTFTKIP